MATIWANLSPKWVNKCETVAGMPTFPSTALCNNNLSSNAVVILDLWTLENNSLKMTECSYPFHNNSSLVCVNCTQNYWIGLPITAVLEVVIG